MNGAALAHRFFRRNVAKRGKASRARRGSRGGRRWKNRLRWTLGLALCAGLAWGGAEAYRAVRPLAETWFEIRHVSVTGLGQVTRDEVIEHMKLPEGETLLSLDVDRVVDRLRSHAWIKEAALTRIPLHGLAVHVIERVPVAVVDGPTVNLLVDADGHVLSVLEASNDLELPLLRGIDPSSVIHGEAGSRRTVRAGIEVAALVREVFQGRPEVDARNPANLVASIGDLRFDFGGSAFEEKWALYRKIRPALQVSAGGGLDAAPSEIDLRYPKKVIVRERG